MLEARMDRQKFSRMMERSDFMNLTGHSGQEQRCWLPAQPAVAGHLLPCPTSDLPPEGSIDGKQREQGHAGHGTANHQGDGGGTRQLQGLQEMGFWETARQGTQPPCLM